MLLLLQLASASDVDLHTHRPAPVTTDVRDPIRTVRAGSIAGGTAAVAVLGGYARDPLLAVSESSGERVGIVANLFHADVMAAYAPADRVRLDLQLPVYGYTGTSIDGARDNGGGIGDARLRATVSLLAADGEGFGLALVPHLDLPTGRFDPWFGRRRVAGGGLVAATVDTGALSASANVGVQIESDTDEGPLPNPDSVLVGGAIGAVLGDRALLHAEVAARLPLQGGLDNATPAELTLDARRVGEGGSILLAGVGTALSTGVGVPGFRLFVGAGFGSRPGPRDADGDGIFDELDACPASPETFNQLEDDDGCPDELPTLLIRASYEGNPMEGANLSVRGPLRRSDTSTVDGMELVAMPGSSWAVTARLGPCLLGEAQVEVRDSDVQLDVPLERVNDGSVQVLVLSALGEVVTDAVVTMQSGSPGCVPDRPFESGGGDVAIAVGQGVHTLIVRHQGQRVERQITVGPGAQAFETVVMEAP